jgi:hypothetical protein
MMRMLALSCVFALPGCAAIAPAPQVAAVVPADPVERVASWLAEADSPDTAPPRRAQLVTALDRSGLQTSKDSDEDPVAQWRAEAAALGGAPIPERGRALGPAYRSGWLEPGAIRTLDQLYLAGQTARISLSSSGRQAIALTISDPASKIICRQDGPAGRCQWVAIFTQRYRIELSNPGKARLRYFLVSN